MPDQPARQSPDRTITITRVCDTCGEIATFIRLDGGATDERWECTHCHAHRYEPRGAAEEPSSGPSRD